MVKIIDCAIAFNETDLFEIRIEELHEVVDAFVVVETNKTHRGAQKPLLFNGITDMFPALSGRVHSYAVDDFPNVFGQRGELYSILEHFQRNCIMRPLSTMDLDPNDIILISDIDEIPSASAVTKLRSLMPSKRVVIFEQIMKKFFLNNASQRHANNVLWRGTVACLYGDLKAVTPQAVRLGDPYWARSACVSNENCPELRPYETLIREAGWHFSSTGGQTALDIKHATVAEGSGSSRSGDFHDRFGRHNHKLEREQRSEQYHAFLAEYAPELIDIDFSDRRAIQNLDIPNCIKTAPEKYEHLFYAKHPCF
ncbi:hypothetical protein [Methylosinus sp. Ce-a6]|uniref:hypothetical protein n=1 Tax=Methylosinus sp. Ce-a6 TaxID=2172005 RepID=UPI001356C15B|nr:hypothetical protein [Methylosinus sp. Ce-a6]